MHSFSSIFTPIVGVSLAALSAVTATPLESRESTWAPAMGGCWTDGADDRALQHFAGGYDDLTPAKCQGLCEDAGFFLAGVEVSRDCYCGNHIMGNNYPNSLESCNMPCAGDSNQTCGGEDSIYIYVRDNFPFTYGPAYPVEFYNGYSMTSCWRDSSSNRVLKQAPSSPIPEDQMTVEKCIDGCAAAGYSSAGVENGSECYCDNVTYPLGPNDYNCSIPCTGNYFETCGGPEHILTYYKPPPPPATSRGGVIEVRHAEYGWFYGYILNYTTVGISQCGMDLSWAEWFTFEVPDNATSITQAEIASHKTINGFPFLGLIQGSANINSDIGAGSFHYLFLGGTSHSGPGATPQTGPNGLANMNQTWESSIWNINITTGDLIPQWINSDGSSPATYVIRHEGTDMFGTGDPAVFNSHFQNIDYTVKLKFNPNPS